MLNALEAGAVLLLSRFGSSLPSYHRARRLRRGFGVPGESAIHLYRSLKGSRLAIVPKSPCCMMSFAIRPVQPV